MEPAIKSVKSSCARSLMHVHDGSVRSFSVCLLLDVLLVVAQKFRNCWIAPKGLH